MHDVRLLIKDDFLPDPYKVRQEVLAREFTDEVGPDGALYPHVQRRPLDEYSDLLENLVGRKVSQTLTMIRLNYEKEASGLPVHSDEICAELACVLYLNTPEQCRGGTAFWRHREMGWDSLPTEKTIRSRGKSPKREYTKIEKTWRNEDAWDRRAVVDMVFNRAIIYPTRCFHSRWPREAFGTTPENGRLIWVSFF